MEGTCVHRRIDLCWVAGGDRASFVGADIAPLRSAIAILSRHISLNERENVGKQQVAL